MGRVRTNMKTILSRFQKAVATAAICVLISQTAVSAGTLQGQNKGNTNTWTSVNLQGWLELDYIPMRVFFNSGSAGAQTIILNFPHISGTTPGIEDLTSFAPFTSNV